MVEIGIFWRFSNYIYPDVPLHTDVYVLPACDVPLLSTHAAHVVFYYIFYNASYEIHYNISYSMDIYDWYTLFLWYQDASDADVHIEHFLT